MKRLKAYIQLTRPLNLAIAFLSIFIGGFVTGTIHPVIKLLLASFSGVFIAAGANSINDYFDVAIDRINRPQRPLPSGRIAPKQAQRFSIILFGAGVFVSLFIHCAGFFIALGSAILLYLYSDRLKRTVLWGNITVAFVSGLAFVYGGLAVGRLAQAAVVGVFAFFFHLGREIIKDVEDMEGDRSQGVHTLPVRYGIKTAVGWATAVLVLLMGITPIPYVLKMFSLVYFLIVLAGVDLFLLYVLLSMWHTPEPRNLGRLAVMMKVDMLVGLLAVYLGR